MADEKRERVEGGRGTGVLRWVEVEWVAPGAGVFGRDKPVPRSSATAANVEWERGDTRARESMAPAAAAALLSEARSAAAASAAAQKAESATLEVEKEQVRRLRENLTCPVCGGTTFTQQLSREDSQWGLTSLPMRLMICRRCEYVMHFSRGLSIFDFD